MTSNIVSLIKLCKAPRNDNEAHLAKHYYYDEFFFPVDALHV